MEQTSSALHELIHAAYWWKYVSPPLSVWKLTGTTSDNMSKYVLVVVRAPQLSDLSLWTGFIGSRDIGPWRANSLRFHTLRNQSDKTEDCSQRDRRTRSKKYCARRAQSCVVIQSTTSALWSCLLTNHVWINDGMVLVGMILSLDKDKKC